MLTGRHVTTALFNASIWFCETLSRSCSSFVGGGTTYNSTKESSLQDNKQ